TLRGRNPVRGRARFSLFMHRRANDDFVFVIAGAIASADFDAQMPNQPRTHAFERRHYVRRQIELTQARGLRRHFGEQASRETGFLEFLFFHLTMWSDARSQDVGFLGAFKPEPKRAGRVCATLPDPRDAAFRSGHQHRGTDSELRGWILKITLEAAPAHHGL